jgi:hypothetical protein
MTGTGILEQQNIRAAEQKILIESETKLRRTFCRSAALPLCCSVMALLFFLTACTQHALAVELKIATFKVDATPPIGSPLCDGLVPPATGVNDPLSTRGIILAADDQKPVVLVAVDWVGIGNEGNKAWREALAKASGTSIDRVCVHALHQHDAPGCDFASERLAADVELPGKQFNVEFAREAIDRAANAAAAAMQELEPVTHVGKGMGRVEKVASNRRILGPDGNVQYIRYSSGAKDPLMAKLPEGIIDPNVRLVSFWNADRPLAVLSYYATHPQSYYYTGKCSADFVGTGRDQAEAHEKTDLHIHFNGASGNVTAGKYNDGSPELRPILAKRLADGMRLAWEATEKVPVGDLSFDWSTRDVSLPVADSCNETERMVTLKDANQPVMERIRASRDIAWSRRMKSGDTISIGRLRMGPIEILHMPGELFVEYQLAAQKLKPEAFVCMAAYGDYGAGYIGTAEAYSQKGGYETGIVSRVTPRAEAILMEAVRELLQ